MKLPVALVLLTIFFLSCSKELYTAKQVNENHGQIDAIAGKLFATFTEQTFIGPKQLDSLGLSDADIRLLKYKIKCPYVQLIYSGKLLAVFPADSIVIFTRSGLNILGNEQDIIVDMRRPVRDSIQVPTGQFDKYYRIRKGIYYVKTAMPAL
ncbi:MAG TPA: hypothetical protein VGS79_20500 [Puia sp.]|nr:hypothetical protein [Puia sp.]